MATLRKVIAFLAIMLALTAAAIGVVNEIRPGTVTLRRICEWFGIPYTSAVMDDDNTIKIVFISVGQGDSTLIVSKDYCALIDAGTSESMKDIQRALDNNGVKRLDALFITHPHADHIGSAAEVIKEYAPDEVFFADIAEDLLPTSYTYEKLLKQIERSSSKVTVLREGDRVDIKSGEIPFFIDVLHSGGGEDLNSSSLVLKLTYGGISAMFMGDNEEETEISLSQSGVDLSCDILKVGHHGTSGASCKLFLRMTSPSYAVISCGIDNDYGYPRSGVLKRLAGVHAAICRTDTMGDITFTTDGKLLEVCTAQNDDV